MSTLDRPLRVVEQGSPAMLLAEKVGRMLGAYPIGRDPEAFDMPLREGEAFCVHVAGPQYATVWAMPYS